MTKASQVAALLQLSFSLLSHLYFPVCVANKGILIPMTPMLGTSGLKDLL